ncbi:uncharacterized protein LOC107045595 [Diachasma alloeum]|uniref:uncharacterized protein LOC107045595 n=1 Tax=Diachasma alloeum TaxID=454923 RepID=UPI000738399C|nr:uncharacterized protein LOC107045595 [Diachasma alloeum]
MGNVLNSGENNDDLVDTLRLLRYIKTKKVERVFRAVDRGDYVLASHRDGAYKDVSWKIGNIHLSAPCVYSKVMEGLSLEAGLSFLNVGSGTGYLSTMAGLLLSHHGTNHGIELNKDCMEYAYERLEEFKQKSQALNEFDFCEPVFIHGNFLRVIPNRQYDRVYCGAACPESHEAFIKQFVKVGGILVMPYKDHLLRIERVDADTWRHKAMLPVAFAALVVPNDEDQTIIQLPSSEPLSLQDLCRCSIRSHLRGIIWQEHPELESRDPITSDTRRERNSHPSLPLSSHVEFVYDDSVSRTSSDNEEDAGTSSRTRLLVYADPRPNRGPQEVRVLTRSKPNSLPELEDSDTDEDVKPVPSKKISIDSMASSSSSSSSLSSFMNHQPHCLHSPEQEKTNGEDEDMGEGEEPMVVDETEPNSSRIEAESKAFTNGNDACKNKPLSAEDHSEVNDGVRLVGDRSNVNSDKSNSSQSESSNCSSAKNGEPQVPEKSFKRDNENKSSKCSDTGEGTSSERCDFQSPAKKKKWRKLLSERELEGDWTSSRLGDRGTDGSEATSSKGSNSKGSNDKTPDSSKFETPDWNSLMSSSDEDDEGSGSKRSPSKNPKVCGIPDFIWDSLFDLGRHMSSNDGPLSLPRESPDALRNGASQVFAHNVHIGNLSEHMRNKIRALPLPVSLQLYINYNRPL